MKFLIFNVIGFLILGLVFSVANSEEQKFSSDSDIPIPTTPGPSNGTTIPTSPPTTSTTTVVPPTTPPNVTTTQTPKPTTLPTTTSTTPSTTTSNGTTSVPTTTPTTPPTNVTTTTSKPSPSPTPEPGRKFDLPSFIGGFVLASGLMAIAVISWKFYLSRQENYYHTL